MLSSVPIEGEEININLCKLNIIKAISALLVTLSQTLNYIKSLNFLLIWKPVFSHISVAEISPP